MKKLSMLQESILFIFILLIGGLIILSIGEYLQPEFIGEPLIDDRESEILIAYNDLIEFQNNWNEDIENIRWCLKEEIAFLAYVGILSLTWIVIIPYLQYRRNQK